MAEVTYLEAIRQALFEEAAARTTNLVGATAAAEAARLKAAESWIEAPPKLPG